MKHRLAFHSLLLLAVFLALAPTALASTKWYVNGVNGSDNNNCKTPQTACKTIGHAISLASSGDSIMVAAATYKENLTIGFSLKILGSGAKNAIIDGGGNGGVVTIPSASASVILSNLIIRNGRNESGGGIFSKAGTLTISNCTISDNTTSTSGGGIRSFGTLTINSSTISGNRASGNVFVWGGGIFQEDKTLTINNSTVSGNYAQGYYGHRANGAGGGIFIYLPTATATINNSTISGNGANARGGGISNGGTAILQNSIVANSPSGGNCAGTMTSNGYNLSSDNTCNFNGPGDLNNTDPQLGQLGNYGGPTQTIPLLSGSPAIDAGNPSGCTDGQGHLLKTDQRGKPRHDKEDTGGCDMGAYERQD